jgi:hypothetical protein
MSKAHYKVFQHGKGTRTLLDFSQGQKQHKLTREGSGHFLGNTFETEEAAVDFCQRELRNDPGVVLYVMGGDLILRMVLDQAVQEERELQRAREKRYPTDLGIRCHLLGHRHNQRTVQVLASKPGTRGRPPRDLHSASHVIWDKEHRAWGDVDSVPRPPLHVYAGAKASQRTFRKSKTRSSCRSIQDRSLLRWTAGLRIVILHTLTALPGTPRTAHP